MTTAIGDSTSASALQTNQNTTSSTSSESTASAVQSSSAPQTSDPNEPAAVGSVSNELTNLITSMTKVGELATQIKGRPALFKKYTAQVSSLNSKIVGLDKSIASTTAKIAAYTTQVSNAADATALAKAQASLTKAQATLTKYNDQKTAASTLKTDIESKISTFDADTVTLNQQYTDELANLNDIVYNPMSGNTSALKGSYSKQGYVGDCYFLTALELAEKRGGATAEQTIKDAITINATTGNINVKYTYQVTDKTGNKINKVYLTSVSAKELQSMKDKGKIAQNAEAITSLGEGTYGKFLVASKQKKGAALTALEGGNSSKVLQAFGIGKGEFSYMGYDTDAQVRAKLTAATANDGIKMYSANSNGVTSGGIVGNHAYALEGFDANTDMVTLVNPWDASQNTVVSLSTFRANFSWLDGADTTVSAYA